MKIVRLALGDLRWTTIPVGFAGENDCTQVQIDCAQEFAEFPTAIPSLTIKSPRRGEGPYPGIVERDGDLVIWTVSGSDLMNSGTGEIQLSFMVNTVIEKSYVAKIRIHRSLLPGEEIPDPIDDWITRANAVLGAIPQTITESVDAALEEAKESGEFDGKDGDPGLDGFSPAASVNKTGNKTTIVITDKDGTTSAEILDGEDGEPGYTPQRGVDYWTEADQQAMREDIASDTAAAQQAIAGDKSAALDAIESAGTTQAGNVNAAGTAQVGNVNAAGAAQVAAVEEKGEEVLESIPSDYSELSGEVSELKNEIDDISVEFTWKNGYYRINNGDFQAQTGTVTYHSTDKMSGRTLPILVNTALFTSDSFIMVWNGGVYAGYLMNGVWKKNTTTLQNAPEFDQWAVTLHNVENYEDVRNTPFASYDEMRAYVAGLFNGRIAYIAPAYTNDLKINIKDNVITIPIYTRVFYGNSAYRITSADVDVSRTAGTGSEGSEEVIVFDSSSKTFKSYLGVNYLPTGTEFVLFVVGNGLSWCSLSPSQYAINGNPAYMPYENTPDIIRKNGKETLTEKIVETRYYGANSKENLVLAHVSDMHGNTNNISRLLELKTTYSDYIDDMIHTGDSTSVYYGNDNPFATVGGDQIMNAIGNHDCWIQGDTWPHPYNATAQQAYEKFISPFIADWDVTSAGTNLCYYYKDYSDFDIRLIVLDALHYDETQEAWFENVLDSAKENELGVIVATHYPPQKGITGIDCTFTSYGKTIGTESDPPSGTQIERLADSAYSVVDDFISGSGKFICWLAGHTHYDFVGTVTDHSNQLVLIVNCGVIDARYGTDKRVAGTKTQDCINIVGFDTSNHLIKICRVGIAMDWFGRMKNYLCVDYSTKQVIANS